MTVLMVLAVLAVILLLAFFRASIWGWLLATIVIVAGVAILNSISGDALMATAITLGVFVLVLGVPFLRRLLISSFILKIFPGVTCSRGISFSCPSVTSLAIGGTRPSKALIAELVLLCALSSKAWPNITSVKITAAASKSKKISH